MKKPTVTIAVSAYNEEQNIINFLKSVLRQNEDGFILKEIWIHSDGSTDKTVELAKSLKNKKIKVWSHKARKGKSTRLNQIYREVDTDLLVQSDADTIFSNPNVVKELVRAFLKDKQIGMCAGNPQPLLAITFIEKADSNVFRIYSDLLKNLKNGRNVFTADGRILTYRKELIKKINIPEDMISNDVYTYYFCLISGYKYKYVKKAIVYFRCPQSFKDKIRQNKRASATNLRMARYFPREIILRESHVPFNVRIKSVILQLFKDPIGSILIFVINKLCQLISKKEEKRLNAKWNIATSTKILRA